MTGAAIQLDRRTVLRRRMRVNAGLEDECGCGASSGSMISSV